MKKFVLVEGQRIDLEEWKAKLKKESELKSETLTPSIPVEKKPQAKKKISKKKTKKVSNAKEEKSK